MSEDEPTRHIYNYGAPPQTSVVVKPRPLAVPETVFSIRGIYPGVLNRNRSGEPAGGADIARELLEELGVPAVPPGGQEGDPERVLKELIRAEVQSRGLRGFALAREVPSDERYSRASKDALLAIVVLTQSAGGVFVAAKEPVIDLTFLKRVIAVRDPRFSERRGKP